MKSEVEKNLRNLQPEHHKNLSADPQKAKEFKRQMEQQFRDVQRQNHYQIVRNG